MTSPANNMQQLVTDSIAAHYDKSWCFQSVNAYTYKDLDILSDRFATHFKNIGLTSQDFVALKSRVRFEAVAAMIGAIKAGIPYIPLNISAPNAWIEQILAISPIKFVLIDSKFHELHQVMQQKQIPTMDTDNLQLPTKIDRSAWESKSPDSLAYVLFTSGSTGTPKGIMISHENAAVFVNWMVQKYQINEHDRILSIAPLQFDLSVFDIFGTLAAGAQLVIHDLDSDPTPRSVVRTLNQEGITCTYTVPSAYIGYVTKGEMASSSLKLRLMLYAGEPFPTPYLRQLMQAVPGAMVANIYGPTETNIVSYFDIIDPPHTDDPIPIGKPCPYADLTIVDDRLTPVEDGTLGQIVCSGESVFMGYYKDPERTSKVLVPINVGRTSRLFCLTGDLGRVLPDGNIAYHGRADSMVKSRGYRIELGEVEAAISAIEGVEEVACVTTPHDRYGCILHAFVRLSNNLTPQIVKVQVESKIPSYMVPFTFRELTTFPKTATGKIDRVGLTDIAQLPEERNIHMKNIFDRIIAANLKGQRETISSILKSSPMFDSHAVSIDQRMIQFGDKWVADFASCNYLGFDLDEQIMDSVVPAMKKWGVHPSWCRLVASPNLYREAEELLADLIQAPNTLILPTVTLIHIGVIPALMGKDGVMILDKSAHMTMYQACKMARDSGSKLCSFNHGDFEQLEQILHEHKHNPKKLILVDGTYSMTGNYADMTRLQDLAAKYDAIVYVDDAHGFGVVGEKPDNEQPYGHKGNGVVRHFDTSYDNILYVGGLSKAYSSLAAFISCTDEMMAYIKAYATPYDLSGPCPTASLQSTIAGLAVNEIRGDEIRRKLFLLTKRLIDDLRGLGFQIDNDTYFPIVSVWVGSTSLLTEAARILWDSGILVTLAPYPMVKRGEEALRITVTASNTMEQIELLVQAFKAIKTHCEAEGASLKPRKMVA